MTPTTPKTTTLDDIMDDHGDMRTGMLMDSYQTIPSSQMLTVEDALRKCEEDLWLFHFLEDWARDNEYITGDYRAYGKHLGFYLQSLWWLHNETVNIWIHFAGFILTLMFQLQETQTHGVADGNRDDGDGWYDRMCFHVFCTCMEVCYLGSVVMHTFYPMSQRVSHTLQRLDYIGIVLLITGNISVFIFFAFEFQYVLQKTYYFLLLGFSVLSLPVVLTTWFVRHRHVRGIFFFLFTSMMVIPIVHRLLFTHDTDRNGLLLRMCNDFALVSFMYAIGGVFYVSRFPERMWPGRFNRFGASHQWFHLFSLLGGCMMCWTYTDLHGAIRGVS